MPEFTFYFDNLVSRMMKSVVDIYRSIWYILNQKQILNLMSIVIFMHETAAQ